MTVYCHPGYKVEDLDARTIRILIDRCLHEKVGAIRLKPLFSDDHPFVSVLNERTDKADKDLSVLMGELNKRGLIYSEKD